MIGRRGARMKIPAALFAASSAVVFAASLLPRPAAADEAPKAVATISPAELSPGQDAVLQIEITGGFRLGAAPTLPLTNLVVTGGPSLENRFEWTNGASTTRTILGYRIQAGHPGPATVGPVRLTDRSGRSIETAPLTIEIGRASAPAAPTAEPTDDPALVSSLDPPSPYAGQQAVWTLYLVTRGQATQGEVESLPDFHGFWAEDLEREGNVEPRIWNIRGVPWRAYPIARKALFPNRSGTITIGPARARVSVRRLSFDFFDSPFGDAPPVERASAPLPVVSRATPAGSGAPVGTFVFRTSLDRDHVPAGAAVSLTAQLSGDGRLTDVAPPALAIPGARVSEPETKLTIKRSASRLASVKTWQWIIVPDGAGRMTVPALSTPAFDPRSGRIAAVSSEPLAAIVDAPAIVAAPPPTPRSGTPPPARPPLPAPILAAAAVAAGIALLAVGFWAGRRGRPEFRPRAVDALLAPEDRIERTLATLDAAARGPEAAARVAEWRRRLESIRFAPVFSSREEAVEELEEEIRREAGNWRTRGTA